MLLVDFFPSSVSSTFDYNPKCCPGGAQKTQKIWELNHFSQAVQLNAATTALAFAVVPTGSGGSVGELGGGEGQEGLRDGEGMACLMLPGSYGELVFSPASPGCWPFVGALHPFLLPNGGQKARLRCWTVGWPSRGEGMRMKHCADF